MDWIATLTPDAAADPLEALSRPPREASMVELRLDLYPELSPALAVSASPLPLVATLRSRAEGGRGPDRTADRVRRLREAAEAGCALIDLEADRDLVLVRQLGVEADRLVLSWHDSSGTPDDLRTRRDALLEQPVRWVKMVPTATSLADLGRVLALHEHQRRQPPGRRRLIAFAMGTVGLPSRYLAPLLGPPLMFVAWSDGTAAAPGQLTARRTQAVAGHLSGPPRRLFGVVGSDVAHSLSPELHAAAYRELEVPDLLLPFSVPDPEELPSLFAPEGETLLDRVGLPAAGWAVTTPYKAHALDAADVAAPRARRARAANTLVLRPGRILAENTDADGVVGALTTLGVDPAGRRAIVQGTGGAARGAAIGLHLAGADVRLRGRDTARTESVAATVELQAMASDTTAPGQALLVNATPLGSDPDDPSPFSSDEVASAVAVVEMVYRDRPTELESLARENGIATVSGREVLAHQAFAQFAAFTGTVPPRGAMRRSLGLSPLRDD